MFKGAGVAAFSMYVAHLFELECALFGDMGEFTSTENKEGFTEMRRFETMVWLEGGRDRFDGFYET